VVATLNLLEVCVDDVDAGCLTSGEEMRELRSCNYEGVECGHCYARRNEI
jgi:hypothetical protein